MAGFLCMCLNNLESELFLGVTAIGSCSVVLDSLVYLPRTLSHVLNKPGTMLRKFGEMHGRLGTAVTTKT